MVERGQRVFPESNRALDVVSSLISFLKEKGVVLVKDHPVEDIRVHSGRIEGVVCGKETIKSLAVILATGGASYPKTGSTGDGYRLAQKVGHTIIPIRPFLVPLEIKESWAKDLQGVALKNVSATIYVNRKKDQSEFGEMLFTHFGISGPIILSLSGRVVDALTQGRVEIAINLKPALTPEQLDLRLQREFKAHHLKGFKAILKLLLPSGLIPVFCRLSGIPEDKKGNQISAEERARLKSLLTDLRLTVSSARPLDEAIVTAGGVRLQEVDPKTLQSKIIPGLFFCGEILDIQGKTGGYNLQAAFSTGWVAGENAAKKVLRAES